MPLKECVYSVLMVSSSEKFNSTLTSLLPKGQFSPVSLVSSARAAKLSLLDRSYDIIIINSPLSDDFGINLAIDIGEKTNSGVLLFVKNEFYDEVYYKTEPYGILSISKPTSSQVILQSLHLLCSTRERLKRLEVKTASIEEKMAEIRIVNRAKWLLIEYLKMNEAEAHRYIEKQAMDLRTSRKLVAENIIKTYG